MSEKNEYKDLEHEMRSYPKLKLDEAAKQKIHEKIIEEADLQEQRQQRGDFMKRIYVGLSSAAVLVLAVGLAFSFKGGNDLLRGVKDSTQEHGDMAESEQNTEEQNPSADDVEMKPDEGGTEAVVVTDLYQEIEGILSKEISKINGQIFEKTRKQGLIHEIAYTSVDQEIIRRFKESLKSTTVQEKDIKFVQASHQSQFRLFDQGSELLIEIIVYEGGTIGINTENNRSFYAIKNSGIEEFMNVFFTDQYFDPENSYSQLYESSQWIVKQLKEKDWENISRYIDPSKGLLFSPYVNINKNAQVFEASEILTFLEDTKLYNWGIASGSGLPIEMTTSQYFERFIFNVDYTMEDEFVYIKEEWSRGNMRSNIKEIFPDSFVVEFYLDGTEENGGMDGSSLNLVFETDEEGVFRLVSIVHDEWSI